MRRFLLLVAAAATAGAQLTEFSSHIVLDGFDVERFNRPDRLWGRRSRDLFSKLRYPGHTNGTRRRRGGGRLSFSLISRSAEGYFARARPTRVNRK